MPLLDVIIPRRTGVQNTLGRILCTRMASELVNIGFYSLTRTHVHSYTYMYVYKYIMQRRRCGYDGPRRGKYAHIYMTEFTIVTRVRF